MKSLSALLGTQIVDTKLSSDHLFESITDNSQELRAGALFFAVRGTKRDGSVYIPEALSHERTGIVVDDVGQFQSHPRTILVRNTRQALAESCAAWFEHPSQKFKLVGITGTNGKTTCTFLLKQLWDCLERKSGLIGTVEIKIAERVIPSELTTPGPRETQRLFAEMAAADVSYAAIEVSSIALDQHRVGGTGFHTVAFTNLSADHLDYHHTFENYFSAKKQLFTEYPHAHAVLNWDDPYARRLFDEVALKNCSRFSFQDQRVEFFVQEAHYSERGTRAQISTPQGTFEIHSPLVGQHNLANLLTVLATMYGLQFGLEEVIRLLPQCPGAPGRLERVPTPKGHVFVDYAHSPDALANVLGSLRTLRGSKKNRILCVFGCGGDRDRTKRPEMARIVSELSNITIATSDNPRTEDPNSILDEVAVGIDASSTQYLREADRRKAIHLALSMADTEDVVLIAGKGHETYQILGTEKVPFDDRTVVREYYL